MPPSLSRPHEPPSLPEEELSDDGTTVLGAMIQPASQASQAPRLP
eukprot:CAMPEP_0181229374 /NCGR_PEP_ID=MMETSP1096-20121128/33859_1 /TAXON_ID=156174 ORGANISM="Chrysochromulina ericina, Strain CCMP281" /NCGR_SAMPLE_ID=MMETSP1096 /ASSEMBLY_ACC=CAM_ASM_000453 /LENGTH=44 /DNA_ID= /DNA_START= /DNA_END= /DNA_ORIENTATION=